MSKLIVFNLAARIPDSLVERFERWLAIRGILRDETDEFDLSFIPSSTPGFTTVLGRFKSSSVMAEWLANKSITLYVSPQS